ncbi:MAG: radical SAM protein [Eubacterium sp.]|nr:radical SAM protein [Eubacterium sp.]
MRYEGNIYRPPSEAYSLLVQVTIGCAYNKCTFCSMFKDKRFRVRDVKEVIEDLTEARNTYRHVDKIFLCDGDAMCLSTDKLIFILENIKALFPETSRVGIYARAQDILRKSPEELARLSEAGLGIAYIGAESGSDLVLERVNKGAGRADTVAAVNKAESNGIKTSVTFISGLGGRELWEEHAIETGKMISEMNASYVSLLTLMLDPMASITEEIARGEFEVLSGEEIVAETYLMMQHANPSTPCVFRSNHASNYVSLRGDLPKDKPKMLEQLKRAMENRGLLKDERFRML